MVQGVRDFLYPSSGEGWILDPGQGKVSAPGRKFLDFSLQSNDVIDFLIPNGKWFICVRSLGNIIMPLFSNIFGIM